MFQQRHYEKIADVIRHEDQTWAQSPGVIGKTVMHQALRNLAIKLSATFRADNPKFNHALFIRACFPEDKP